MNLLEIQVDIVNYELYHLHLLRRLHILQLRINLLQLELRAEKISVRQVVDLPGQFSFVFQDCLYSLLVVNLLSTRIKRTLRFEIPRRLINRVLPRMSLSLLRLALFSFVYFVG